MLNPSPVPFPGGLVVKKASITLSAISGGMGAPEFETAIPKLSPRSSASTLAHGPGVFPLFSPVAGLLFPCSRATSSPVAGLLFPL
jgi:hypothetical protein